MARKRQQHEAYLKVFGPPGNRTPFGELILKDLESFARYGDTALRQDKQGRFDGGATAYVVGLQDVIKRIHLKIETEYDDSSGHTD